MFCERRPPYSKVAGICLCVAKTRRPLLLELHSNGSILAARYFKAWIAP
jgi:hypothetical protein